MFYLKIKLTFIQMYNLGIHLGHSLSVSKFLSYWIFGGWRGSLFIINLLKTRFMLKNVTDVITFTVKSYRPIWFINLDQNVGTYINRYAILTGEPYVTYYWINGTLTNYRSIFSWYRVLYKLLKTEKYKLRHRDKNKLLNYFGFLLNRSAFPGFGFISSTLKSWKAVNEFWALTIPCAAIVDSNVLSWNISLPIPGNDDSLICLNYYCFIVARSIIYSKCFNIWKFKYNIKVTGIFPKDVLRKKKLVLAYLFKKDIKRSKELIQNTLPEVDLLKNIGWEFKHIMFDMTIFNTEYSVFRKSDFFKFFGITYSDFFSTYKDNKFINDPYRIY